MKRSLFFPALLLLSGCAHTSTLHWTPAAPGEKSSSGNPVKWRLTGVNNGMYLFNFIPLWSGYPSRPNRHEYELFQHLLTRPHMKRLLSCKLKPLEADRVEDIKISETSSGAAGLWIIWKRTMRASGAAVQVIRKK